MKTFLLSTLTALTFAITSPVMAHEGHGKDDDEGHIYNRNEIQKIVVETIMQNPEILIESIQQMQANKEKQEMENMRQVVEAYRTSIYEDPNTPHAGNPDGDVTIVEFFDYNCGYCKRSLPNVMKLLANDKNVRILFKEFPILSPTSRTPAQAAIAVHLLKPEKYFDYHSALFKLGGQYTQDNLAGIAESMGIDRSKFIEKMNSKEVSSIIDKNIELGQKMGARGVPLFIVGKEFMPGAASYEAISSEVARIRAGMQE